MAIVHSYLRFSTAPQSFGDSERRQLENGQAWATKHGHTFSDLRFIDRGRSSYSGDHQKQLTLFLKAMRHGKDVKPGDILLVEAIDRLSRKGIRKTQKLMIEIFEHGIHIAIFSPLEKTYRADQDDIGSAIELAAFSHQAQLHSELLAGRIKSWWQGARKIAHENGKPIPSSPTLYWLTRKDGKFKVIKERAAAIRFIFKEMIKGVGGTVLCKKLNKKYPKPKRFNKTKQKWIQPVWNQTYVRDLVRQRAVLGEYQTHEINEQRKRVPIGDPIPMYYQHAIVNEETWQQANDAMDGRVSYRGPAGSFVNLFVSLIYNVLDEARCQIYTFHTFKADGTKVIHRRIKSQKARHGVEGACTATVDIKIFEKTFLTMVNEIDLSIFEDRKASETPDLTPTIARKRRRLKALKAKLNKDEAEAEDLDLDFLSDAIREVTADIEKLQKQQRTLRRTVDGHQLKTLAQMSETPEDRLRLRDAIQTAVEKINILPMKTGPNRKDPVACLAEIVFHGGEARWLMIHKGVGISVKHMKKRMTWKEMMKVFSVYVKGVH